MRANERRALKVLRRACWKVPSAGRWREPSQSVESPIESHIGTSAGLREGTAREGCVLTTFAQGLQCASLVGARVLFAFYFSRS
jgi:hypothetical protein